VFELSWLLERDYSDVAALKLVGDRHSLDARQRKAVLRASCSEPQRIGRATRRVSASDLRGGLLEVDGFNAIIVTESLLSGAPVFVGRDGAFRDLASVQGAWQQVSATRDALRALFETLAWLEPSAVHWLLDRPVSHSGKLRALLFEEAARAGIPTRVDLVDDPDALLAESGGVVASADAWILDRCAKWFDIPDAVARRTVPQAWLVDLRGEPPGPTA